MVKINPDSIRMDFRSAGFSWGQPGNSLSSNTPVSFHREIIHQERRQRNLTYPVMEMKKFHQEDGEVYVIQVAGIVKTSWSKKLGGLSIVKIPQDNGDGNQVTRLQGWLPDQAALHGILTTLYNHRYKLLSVECLNS